MKLVISKKWRIILSIFAMLCLVILALVAIKSGPRPECNRALDGAFQSWRMENGWTNVYPNAGGIGSNSLATVEPYFGGGIQQYGYLPGLTCNDPRDLVLLYLKTKSHYSWHGDTQHTIFSPLRWIVISPIFIDDATADCPEGGELLDTAEFKRRIERTIAFLKERQRPNWQVVAKEQTDFLNSIKE